MLLQPVVKLLSITTEGNWPASFQLQLCAWFQTICTTHQGTSIWKLQSVRVTIREQHQVSRDKGLGCKQ